MIYIFIAASYFPWLMLENPDHSVVLSCMEWIIWLMAASGIAYQQVKLRYFIKIYFIYNNCSILDVPRAF